MFDIAVVRKFHLSEQVEAHHGKDNDPECDVNFAVEDAPMVSLVGYAQEL